MEYRRTRTLPELAATRRHGRRRLLGAGLPLAFAAALATRLGTAVLAAEPPARRLGGDFELTDMHGQTFRLAAQRGKLVLIQFGYTSCPDICPTGMQLYADLLRGLGGAAENVLPLFVSVDPGRDAPEMLAAYVGAFDPRILALTGSEEALRKVAAMYGARFDYVDRKARPAHYTVDHSAGIHVVDRAGVLVAIIPHGTPVDTITRRLRPLLE